MRSFVLTVAILVTFSPAYVAAELVRLELGSESQGGVPTTFEQLAAWCTSAGFTISYQVLLPYNSNSSGSDAAIMGWLTVLVAGDAIELYWLEFDEVSAVAREVERLEAGSGATGSLDYRVSGRRMLQAFAQSGNRAAAQQLLETLTDW